MPSMDEEAWADELLQGCTAGLRADLAPSTARGLREWWQREKPRTAALTRALIAIPAVDWDAFVQDHRTPGLGDQALPPFTTLVARTLDAQITPQGVASIRRILADRQPTLPRLVATDQALVFHYGYFVEPWFLVGALFAAEARRDWLTGVIVPSVRRSAEVKPCVAAGIAACLETSARCLVARRDAAC